MAAILGRSSSWNTTASLMNQLPPNGCASSDPVELLLSATRHCNARAVQKKLQSCHASIFVGGNMKCSRRSWHRSLSTCTGKSPGANLTMNCGASFESSGSSALCLYSVLGISQNVGLPEIKSAFRHLARKYHPDVVSRSPASAAGDDERTANIRFMQMKDAYHTLADPHLRTAYDQQQQHFMITNNSSVEQQSIVIQTCRRGSSDVHADYGMFYVSLQWEDQLSGLRQKSQRSASSWGARMRSRMIDVI